uniref:Odorant receptor n=1 Tax=Conogethes punctiferalis TaxID=1133088 RepID=A0A1Y9TJT9_CONPF|nr:odorant receptor 55 [Conogethes punctiferalis]
MENLRKFGLNYCDLPTMLWNVTCLLRVLTLNIDSRYKKRVPAVFYVVTAVVSAGYFYVYLVSMAWFVFYRCRQTGDLIAAMIAFSLGISSEIGSCKLLYMFIYERTVRDIVDGYLACDALNTLGSRFSQNVLKVLRFVKKRALLFWIVIVGNGAIYVLKAVVTPGRHMMEDGFLLYGLEPMYESPNYEIAFFLCCLGVCYTCYLPANITAFCIVLVGYSEATMLALGEELINLWSDAQQCYKDTHNTIDTTNAIKEDPNSKNIIVNNYIKARLKDIVKIHMININLIRQFEIVFRGAIALEFLLLITGIIAELLGGLENTYIEMPFALMQVAIDCLTGQRMMDACVIFENSVYDCKWENFNVANRRTVLLILQSSQKTIVLSAGGMAKLSFSCFMTVIRSIYSAYTALQSTMVFA